jgi:hypothetical protein
MPYLLIVLVVGVATAILVVLSRANEVCLLSVRDGRPLLVRGRLPPSLIQGFTDALRLARIRDATIRVVKHEGGARVLLDGGDENVQQRLRNVLGTHPWRALASAPLAGTRNLGQLLGIAWLAWLLLPRR